MHTKKQINARIKQALKEDDKELAGMLGAYYQLKYSWIPQVQERFLAPDPAGLYTPHRCEIKDSVKEQIIKEYNLSTQKQ